MSGSRVDVWDPSTEGPWIVEQLRCEGLDVASVRLADVVLTRADLVVMAGDAEGALGALKLLRDEGMHGDVPVILVGVPDGMEHHGEGPAFGADAVFARPVAFEPLLSSVRRLLREAGSGPQVSEVGVARVEHTMRLPGEADGASSQVYELRSREDGPWRPREPTLQLGREEDASSVVTRGRVDDLPRELLRRAEERADVSWREPHEREGEQPDRSRREGTASRTPTGSRPGTGPSLDAEVPEPEIPPEQRAALSPWLHELLRAADRRVFPERLPPRAAPPLRRRAARRPRAARAARGARLPHRRAGGGRSHRRLHVRRRAGGAARAPRGRSGRLLLVLELFFFFLGVGCAAREPQDLAGDPRPSRDAGAGDADRRPAVDER
ncbi:MAG: hypothetical protein M5U28_27855 [Sandaracinaceae bacterium]|nr:hypothetical protein [Sandaracinaceae bacterium]